MWAYNYNYSYNYNNTSVLYHHGIKGQRWGVRRYQYSDGSLTAAGRRHYGVGGAEKESFAKEKVRDVINTMRYKVTGKQYVDSVLKEGTTFARIQTSETFENFAFYATYKKDDMDKYLGLFGKNLRDRAAYNAKAAKKEADASGSEEDIFAAQEAQKYSDNLKVYQLKITATKKLRVPSDENAGDITAKLLHESQFKSDVIASIADSKAKMKRPGQQILFKQAQNALKKAPAQLSSADKIAIYKALNLSLTNHNEQEISAQNRFYSELKKKGYNALLDYNDKEYSSYHAKRPMIVFDVDSVKLSAVTETNPKVVDELYKKYNAERIRKEISAQTIGNVKQYMNKTVAESRNYVNRKVNSYLEQNDRR